MNSNYFDLINQHPELFDNDQAAFQIITDPVEIRSWEESNEQRSRAENRDAQWAKIGILISDPYILVLRDLVKAPDGRKFGYIRIINQASLENGEAVAVLPVMAKQVLLLHLYRHATRQWNYEIPRGYGTPGLPAADNARKELLEEVEGSVTRIIDLGIMHVNTGLEEIAAHLFYADLEKTGNPQQAEGIDRLHWVNFDDFEIMIRDGEITDSFTIAAYSRAKLKGFL